MARNFTPRRQLWLADRGAQHSVRSVEYVSVHTYPSGFRSDHDVQLEDGRIICVEECDLFANRSTAIKHTMSHINEHLRNLEARRKDAQHTFDNKNELLVSALRRAQAKHTELIKHAQDFFDDYETELARVLALQDQLK